MKKLKELDISNTDINEVDINKLPNSLKNIECSTKSRLTCKLTAIVSQLEKVRYGWCQNCQQPNTGKNLCQLCVEKELAQLNGQELIEKFIQWQKLEEGKKQSWQLTKNELQWIPYQKFTNIEHIADGGFSKIYKAKWNKKGKWSYGLNKYKEVTKDVVLKSLNNSQNITWEFLTEIANTKLVDSGSSSVSDVVKCYGISQDPITKNYVMVMKYMAEGNLRQYLQQKGKEMDLEKKLFALQGIALGLGKIHNQSLVHCDFHSGNILGRKITDLGLSRSANSQPEEGKIYGVLPYVAPEVLQGKACTQDSDIYSFGIIAYELFANAYPYPDLKDLYPNLESDKERETQFAMDVCNGLRPNIEKLPIPQLLKDLIKKCWDADPQKRPTADKLGMLNSWWSDIPKSFHKDFHYKYKTNSPFLTQYQALKDEYNHFSQTTPYQIHPTAILTSKPINTKQIAQLLQNPDQQQQALELEIKKLEKEIGRQFTKEQKELVKEFISIKKKIAEGKEDEDKVWELEDKLNEKEILEEDVNEIILYCDRLIEKLEGLQLQAQVEIIPTNK